MYHGFGFGHTERRKSHRAPMVIYLVRETQKTGIKVNNQITLFE